ncbi:hypothetical protein D3C73_1029840 [compost metagenome]
MGKFVAQVVGGFQFGGQPCGAGIAHHLAPGLERAARRQARALVADRVLLLGLAAPHQRFDLLFAQPDQPAVVHRVELAGQQAGIGDQIGLQIGVVAGDVVGMHQALATLVQRTQNARQFAARRDAAKHRDAVAPQAQRGVVRDQ